MVEPGLAEHGGGLHVQLRQAGPISLAVEFSCEQGELLALIGVSGSGKTTTLRSIAGLYRPRDALVRCNGAVWLDTKHGLDLPPHLRPVGLVFQTYALFPHMTALGNVVAALGHRPSKERRERARVGSSVRYARLSLSGRNLLRFTGYRGLDPEVSNFGNQAIVRNIDVAPFPPNKSFFFSIDLGF